MQKLSVILLVTIACVNLIAQDTVYTKDNQKLNVKIFEKTDKAIKCKMLDYLDGPMHTIKLNSIEKIRYQNGQTDLMGNQNPRTSRPFGINTGMVFFLTEEAGYILINIDYFILPQVDLQVNIGSDTEEGTLFSIGSEFHLNSNYSENKFTPYTGMLFGSEYGYGFIQFPVGINYIGKKGLNASLSLNELIYFNEHWQSVFLKCTIGWKFKL